MTQKTTETKTLAIHSVTISKNTVRELSTLYKNNFVKTGQWQPNQTALKEKFTLLCDDIQFLLITEKEEQDRDRAERIPSKPPGNKKKELEALRDALAGLNDPTLLYLRLGFFGTRKTNERSLDTSEIYIQETVKNLSDSVERGLEILSDEPSRGGKNRTKFSDMSLICRAAFIYKKYFIRDPVNMETEAATTDFKKFLQCLCDSASPYKYFCYTPRNIAAGIDLFLLSEHHESR